LRQEYEKGQAAEEFLAKLAREPDRAPKFLNGAAYNPRKGLREGKGCHRSTKRAL